MIRSHGLIFLSFMILSPAFPAAAQEDNSRPEIVIAPSESAPVTMAVPDENAAAPVVNTAGGRDLSAAEWKFIRSCGEDKSENVVSVALPELTEWLRTYPDSEHAPAAQLLKANIHIKSGEYKFAVVDLLKHVQDVPGGQNAEVIKLLNDTVEKKMDKKTKLLVADLVKPHESADKAERLAELFKKLAERAGEDLYEPVLNELTGFLSRFPAYSRRDSIQLALADLHNKKQEYLPAKLAYEKLIRVYEGSPLLVKAKRALGNVLANNIKDYDAAIVVYQDIAVNYPGTEEAWIAYGQLAKLSERQKKYPLAIETYEKIITLYPDNAAAYDAYKSEARILRDEMAKYPEAVAVLGRLADKYKGEKGIEALYLAAKIASKDMKDLDGEIKMYDRIAGEYSGDAQAPKALFAAAEAYEGAKNFEKAREYFSMTSEKYPEDALSAKAQKRLNAIINK